MFGSAGRMSGKGAKGLLTGKTPASKDKDKDKKKPISRSSRAGLQIISKSNRRKIAKHICKEGMCYAFGLRLDALHPEFNVPNLDVIKLMQSFTSQGYARETVVPNLDAIKLMQSFTSQTVVPVEILYFWQLTADGARLLSKYHTFPPEIAPASATATATATHPCHGDTHGEFGGDTSGTPTPRSPKGPHEIYSGLSNFVVTHYGAGLNLHLSFMYPPGTSLSKTIDHPFRKDDSVYGGKGCSWLYFHPHEGKSLSETIDLPFRKDDSVYGGKCRSWLYFHAREGKVALYNLTSKTLKLLPLPHFDPPPHKGYLHASGMGYDSTSRQFKLIRNCVQDYRDEPDEEGRHAYRGGRDYMELYSFKYNSWKEIVSPKAHETTHPAGVYVEGTGCCYWTACHGGQPDEWVEDHVLLFDFSREVFDHIPLPTDPIDDFEVLDGKYMLVDFSGYLGALAYWKSLVSGMSVELFMWKDSSWESLYSVTLADVVRPVGLTDNRFLFGELDCKGVRWLMVYDLASGQLLKKLDIYDMPKFLNVYAYEEDEDEYEDGDKEDH